MIYSFRYHHTNCFFISNQNDTEYMAFDCGWPCTYYAYLKKTKEIGISIDKVHYLIVSHFHLDHAGLFGQFQEENVKCIAFDIQLPFIDTMEHTIKKILNAHSEDSIGYFSDDKVVLIGDLAPINQVMNDDINCISLTDIVLYITMKKLKPGWYAKMGNWDDPLNHNGTRFVHGQFSG